MRIRKDTPGYMLQYSHLDYKSKEYQQAYRRESKRNPSTWLTKTYSRMKRDNGDKFNLPLPFTKDEFREWAFVENKDNFESLFSEYISSNFDRYKNPSIDRIDDYESYNFSNMQLISWKDNDEKGYKSAKSKENHAELPKIAKKMFSKPVQQVSLEGEILCEYPSVREAWRQTGYDHGAIARVCRGELKRYRGYGWRYKNA